ncbi:MAG: hypothetical protein J6H18_06010, partial [Lachnospiraceae bacterium]|nr:hypothetical protein [Lachnospiraceae bacterium]
MRELGVREYENPEGLEEGMLENLRITFLIIFPFLAYLLIGFFLKRIRVLEDDFTAKMNRLLANVLLPVNIFNSLYNKDIS